MRREIEIGERDIGQVRPDGAHARIVAAGNPVQRDALALMR